MNCVNTNFVRPTWFLEVSVDQEVHFVTGNTHFSPKKQRRSVGRLGSLLERGTKIEAGLILCLGTQVIATTSLFIVSPQIAGMSTVCQMTMCRHGSHFRTIAGINMFVFSRKITWCPLWPGKPEREWWRKSREKAQNSRTYTIQIFMSSNAHSFWWILNFWLCIKRRRKRGAGG